MISKFINILSGSGRCSTGEPGGEKRPVHPELRRFQKMKRPGGNLTKLFWTLQFQKAES